MSDLTFNKIAGAVLATGLGILGLGTLSGSLYAFHPAETAGYAVEIVEEAGAGAAEEALPIDWGTVLPVADIAAGEVSAKKCVSCHTFTPGGANLIGPALYDIVGRKPGGHAGYAYSPSLVDYAAENPAWDYEHISAFVEAPGRYIRGTKMTFVGVRNEQERINLIAYLRSLSPSPAPIPAPNPPTPAAPAEDEAAPAEAAATEAAAPAPAQG